MTWVPYATCRVEKLKIRGSKVEEIKVKEARKKWSWEAPQEIFESRSCRPKKGVGNRMRGGKQVERRKGPKAWHKPGRTAAD